MGEKTFNLTWNNHLANLSGLFEGLYKSGSLTDATLVCQGGMLRAHRLVLAACSPYFERVFKEHYGEQPILILKGVAVEEMEYLLDFMYRGSIDVIEEHLPSLIKTATDLEIRGLSGDQRHQESSRSPYTRVDARTCHIETRVHTTEYAKEQSVIPFLPKQSSIESLEDNIKVEEIEVEDDPMVIDEQEDTFGDPLQSPIAEIESSKNMDDSPRLTIKKKSDNLTKRSGLYEGKEVRCKSEKAQYKPFSCDLCTLAFSRASHLARHRRVHTGERPFGCSICPRMFARQDKLKLHLESHVQWPQKKNNLSSSSSKPPSLAVKGKRGRPKKQVNLEQTTMEEILKFGEFSSLLNKSHSVNATSKKEEVVSVENERKTKKQEEYTAEEENEDKDKDANRDEDNYDCQVENGNHTATE